MKRFLSLLISMMFIVSSVGVVGFADSSEHWAYDSIKGMLEDGIISGDQNGNLNLDNFVTRAEFAKVINKYFGFTVRSQEGFNDVDEGAWYYNDLLIAKGHGYMVGDQNKNANPNANITRAEVAVIVARILNLEDVNDISFSDDSDIPDWAKGKIGALVKEGIIKGYADGTFKAGNAMTRAEAFVVISRNERHSLPSNEAVDSNDMGNQSSMPQYNAGNQGAVARPSGSGGGGGGGGSSTPALNTATIKSRYFNKDTGEIEFISTFSQSYEIKFDVNGTSYEKPLTLTSENGTYKYASFTGLIETLVNEVGVNGFNADVYIKANGVTGYRDSNYLKFGQIYCELAIPDVTNIKAEETNPTGIYTLTWDSVPAAVDYLITVYSDNELKNKITDYTEASTTKSIDLSGVDVGKECYITVDAKVGNFYGVSKAYKETVTIGFAGGNGTIEEPYEISSLAHLNNVKSVLGKSYILKSDITTNEAVVSLPDEFSGNFDGNGYTITANITGSGNVALFPKMSSGAIRNLTVDGSFSGTGYVSSFVSQTSGAITIENCVNKASVTSTSGASWIGGIVARSYDFSGTKFINCINYGDVTNGSVCAGGIVGVPHGVTTIEKCANFGTITATDRAGGIVGEAYNSDILYSYNFGKITAPKAGGIFALCNKDGGTSAIGCFNAGKIEGTTYSAAIGIASASGTNRAVTVSDCYNINSDVSMGTGGTVTIKNSFTVNENDIYEGLTNISLAELINIKPSSSYTLLSENASNDDYNKNYLYPQIIGNIVPKDVEISNFELCVKDLAVSYNDAESKYYLSWTAPLGGTPSNYKVYINDTLITETTLASIDISSFVEEENTYDFKVVAVFNELEFETTKEITVPAVSKFTDVGKPTDVSLKYDYLNQKFNLVWKKSTEATASKFEIYINDSKVGETTDGNTEIFDITSYVEANTAYTARVDAIVGSKIAQSEAASIDTTLNFYTSNGIMGSGTEQDPYIIDEASKFSAVFGESNTDASTYAEGKYYKITKDLTIENHVANRLTFRGVLFADENKTISLGTLTNKQWYMDSTQCTEFGITNDNSHRVVYAALFITVSGATIENITLEGTMSNSNAHHVGAFAALAKSTTIKNCVNEIDIPATSAGTNGAVGGLVGAVVDDASIVDSCVNYGDITGKTAVGGIVGKSKSEITDCKNYGAINGTNNVGGIVGDSSAVAVTDCENHGNVSATNTWALAGGIVGCQRTKIEISECINYGAISCGNGANSYSAGGIVGYIASSVNGANKVLVSECVNAGNISTTKTDAYPGAIIGYAQGNLKIINSMNTGTVSGGAGQGRVVGYAGKAGTAITFEIENFCDGKSTTARNAIGSTTSAQITIINAYGLSETPDGSAVSNELTNVSSDALKALITNGSLPADVWELKDENSYPYPTLINNPYFVQ